MQNDTIYHKNKIIEMVDEMLNKKMPFKKIEEFTGWTMEELLDGEKEEKKVPMFARAFEELSEEDQEEIINLIKFKKMYKEKKISE